MVSSTRSRRLAGREKQASQQANRQEQVHKFHGGILAGQVARRPFEGWAGCFRASCGIRAVWLAAPRCPGGADGQRAVAVLLGRSEGMTEAEWLACTDARRMLHFTTESSGRKLRLFACNCCNSVWHLLEDQRSRRAVEVAEQFADDLATNSELHRVRYDAQSVFYRERVMVFNQDVTTLLVLPTPLQRSTLTRLLGMLPTKRGWDFLLLNRGPTRTSLTKSYKTLSSHSTRIGFETCLARTCSAPSFSTLPCPAGTTARYRNWPKVSTMTVPSTAFLSSLTLSKKAGAAMATSSITAASRANMCAAVGSWT